MNVAESLHELHTRNGITRVALACGVFDGVHRGHQRILQNLLTLGRQVKATPVVLTFDPHPRAILRPDNPPPFLSTTKQKLELFDRAGVEATVILNFTPGLASLSATAFLQSYLFEAPLDVRGICVGAGWRFGAHGEGDTNMLSEQGRSHGFRVVSVPELEWYGKVISSTRIRNAITRGELRKATRMLGRRYAVRGRVVHGHGVGGERLHCRTANLVASELLLPPHGVYAARGRQCTADCDHARPRFRDGIAYIGDAPTFTDEPRGTRLEFHFFNQSMDLYGNEIEVEFADFIRSDRRFPCATALSEQMKQDIAQARAICATLKDTP